MKKFLMIVFLLTIALPCLANSVSIDDIKVGEGHFTYTMRLYFHLHQIALRHCYYHQDKIILAKITLEPYYGYKVLT